MLQIIRFVLQKCQKTVMSLLFGNVSDTEVLLRDELTLLTRKHPDRLRVAFSIGPELTEEMINSTMPPPDDHEAMLFVSGPPGMMMAIGGGGRKDPIGGILGRLGYTHVHKY
jgi:cytochrome-b5 reductase